MNRNDTEKQKRLAEALRANLKKRKMSAEAPPADESRPDEARTGETRTGETGRREDR